MTKSSPRRTFYRLRFEALTLPFLPVPYQFDLHCHSYFSADGVSSPESLIAAARRKGLHGFAMTDHNTCEAVDYMISQGLMREDGKPVDGFLVIPGVEVTTEDGHLLCLGAKLPDMKGRPASEVCERIHEAGGLAVPPTLTTFSARASGARFWIRCPSTRWRFSMRPLPSTATIKKLSSTRRREACP